MRSKEVEQGTGENSGFTGRGDRIEDMIPHLEQLPGWVIESSWSFISSCLALERSKMAIIDSQLVD
jgi:hypothetical protein